MSSHAAEAVDTGHGHHAGPDHVPHVAPYAMYFGVWSALVVFTVITVAVSRFDFGDWNLIIALAIATTKATLVALFFMHLLWDSKFHAIILVSSLIFLSIFIGFSSADLFRRGLADPIEARHPVDITAPFEKMRPLESHSAKHGEHSAHHAAAEHGAAPAGEHAAAPAGEHGAAPAGEHGEAPAVAPSH